MPATSRRSVFQRVQAHAFSNLSFEKQETTNLHLDGHVYKKGELIGPAFQEISASMDSILVFADDDPRANFGHACRYLLYDAKNGDFHREVTRALPANRGCKTAKNFASLSRAGAIHGRGGSLPPAPADLALSHHHTRRDTLRGSLLGDV